MIRFVDKLDKTESAESPEQSRFKEIKPILKTSDDKVQDYWKDVFSDDKSSDDITIKHCKKSMLTLMKWMTMIFKRSEVPHGREQDNGIRKMV